MERFLLPIKQLFRGESHRRFLPYIGAGAVVLGLGIISLVLKESKDQFLSGTVIAGVSVEGLTQQEAIQALTALSPAPAEHTLEIVAEDGAIASSSAELEARFAYEKGVLDAFRSQHEPYWQWLVNILTGAQQTTPFSLPLAYSPEKLLFMIEALAQETDEEPDPPSARLGISGQISSLTIHRGSDISTVDVSATLSEVQATIGAITSDQLAQSESSEAFVATVSAVRQLQTRQLTDEELAFSQERAEKIVGRSMEFSKDYLRKTLTDVQLISLLQLPEGLQEERLSALLQEWAQDLNRPPQNAEFEYDPETLVVKTFAPHRMGLMLDLPAMQESIESGLAEIESPAVASPDASEAPDTSSNTSSDTPSTITKELALTETAPEKTLANTNDLGIIERIGYGESYYAHSIPTRIHNVSLTTGKISLKLVAPGEEYSFNKELGDVSAATGFRPAYVIKDGQTVLGDGGGVCQVSSTLFRALLDAGLNITLRLPHSYRVSYYELNSQPGFDATVYAGNVDLRWKNDTEHYVLVYAQADSNRLHMFVELYGTSDGRTTEISGYQAWDARPPLPTEYVPDPSLAPGQLRQIDWAASGIRTKFTHTIRDKNGVVMSQKDYVSNYRPWAAKFLQGV